MPVDVVLPHILVGSVELNAQGTSLGSFFCHSVFRFCLELSFIGVSTTFIRGAGLRRRPLGEGGEAADLGTGTLLAFCVSRL